METRDEHEGPGNRIGGPGASEEKRQQRKIREGMVVSNKMDKTVVVVQKRRVPHPLTSGTSR